MDEQLNSSGTFSKDFPSLLREIQNDLETKNIKPKDFKGRIIFMSMFNGKRMMRIVFRMQKKSRITR